MSYTKFSKEVRKWMKVNGLPKEIHDWEQVFRFKLFPKKKEETK